MTLQGKLLSVNLSPQRGAVKSPVQGARLIAGHGIEGDGHAGDWHRQVSLLSWNSVRRICEPGQRYGYGEFAENFDVDGLDLHSLPIGSLIRVGRALLEVTQIGKDLREHPSPFELKGNGLMPRQAVFARVIEGAQVAPGDAVSVVRTSAGG